MASTGERMLELLALLQSRRRWTGDELADRLGISERTLRRDIDRLRALGYPVHAERGIDGGYRLGAGARLPPLLITGDEALAVALGLRHAASQPIAGVADAAVRALVKLVEILPAEARRDVEAMRSSVQIPAGSGSEVSLDTLTALARASRDAERARFAYRNAAGTSSERSVEPHHVVSIGRRWYLVAWDLDNDDWRTFRLDRITEPHITKRRFDPRPLPAPDAATFVTQRLASLPATYRVDVVVEAPLAAVEHELGPWGTAADVGDGTTRITMDADDLSWVVLMLAALDADIRSVEPPELLTLLHSLGRRFVDCGAGAGARASS